MATQHAEARSAIIRSQIAQAGDEAIVVVGDSITESALLPTELCGHQVVNAGVGGADPSSYLDTIIKGIPAFKASVIVVALGTNNATSSGSSEQFEATYRRLIQILSAYSSRIIIAGIPSIEKGYLSDSLFDQESGEKINNKLKSIAHESKLLFIDLRWRHSDVQTVDGIHLTPAAYNHWKSAVIQSVRKSLAC